MRTVIPPRINKPKKNVRLFILVGLVLQTTATVLLMQHSRRTHDKDKIRYSTSTAVCLAEFFKMCIGILYVFFSGPAEKGRMAHLCESACGNTKDFLKMGVPGALYLIQNNLLFIALSNLDSAVYQVVYQLKTLTTAIFSVTMLNKSLSKRQWGALVLLFIGASLAQVSTKTPDPENDALPGRNMMLGLGACLSATLSSGFAGVYFEKVLKHTKPSLWVRNIQLGFFGTVTGFIMILAKDYDAVVQNGFFGGYDASVWGVIFLNTVGGYLVALTVKYTSQIIKAFANGFSIILGSISAVFLFDFTLNPLFFLAAILVAVAVFLFQVPQKKKQVL